MTLVKRLGHATLSTRDMSRQVDYYTRMVGLSVVAREPKTTILSTNTGVTTLILKEQDTIGLSSLAFQVSPSDNLSEIASQLAIKGLKSELKSDPAPGVTQALVLNGPDGVQVELFSSFVFGAPNNTPSGVMPFKLGHVACLTRDTEQCVKFYTEILGFRYSDWRSDGAAYFLRCNSDHHTVNFFRSDRNMIEHIAFELKDASEVNRACDVLVSNNIKLNWGPSRHIIGHNYACYHYIPDGFRIEFYAEMDQMKDESLGFFESRPWHVDRPQRPREWGPEFPKNYWGAY